MLSEMFSLVLRIGKILVSCQQYVLVNAILKDHIVCSNSCQCLPLLADLRFTVFSLHAEDVLDTLNYYFF